jgi:hypothetical protein
MFHSARAGNTGIGARRWYVTATESGGRGRAATHVCETTVNSEHRRLCASDEWAQYLREKIVPWTLGEHELGGMVLELGSGSGRSTELLRLRFRRLAVVENDRKE